MTSAASTFAVVSDRPSERTFIGVSIFLLTTCWAATILWSCRGPAMPAMKMCGEAVMPAASHSRPGPIGPGTALSFLGMWAVMMVAMMLPSLVPMLRRYRAGLAGKGACNIGLKTLLAGSGYFASWSGIGMFCYAFSMALPDGGPIAAGVAVIVAGAFQFTGWKARYLACCRGGAAGCRRRGRGAGAAFRHGLWLGSDCSRCCANLMAILLVTGMMDFGVMIAVTAAVTVERLAPSGRFAARSIGVIVIGCGLVLLVQAV